LHGAARFATDDACAVRRDRNGAVTGIPVGNNNLISSDFLEIMQ